MELCLSVCLVGWPSGCCTSGRGCSRSCVVALRGWPLPRGGWVPLASRKKGGGSVLELLDVCPLHGLVLEALGAHILPVCRQRRAPCGSMHLSRWQGIARRHADSHPPAPRPQHRWRWPGPSSRAPLHACAPDSMYDFIIARCVSSSPLAYRSRKSRITPASPPSSSSASSFLTSAATRSQSTCLPA